MINQMVGSSVSAFGERLKNNIPLSAYSPLGVGGTARYFYVAKNICELGNAVAFAHKEKLPYVVIGNGRNIIFSDEKFDGLVIKNESSNILFSPDSSEVIADSGVDLSRLINLSAGRDLGGLEFLTSSLDTVGGALYGNVGRDRLRIGDFVKSLTLLLYRGGEISIESYPAVWMSFEDNCSKLKNLGISYYGPVILTVRLQLVRRRKDEILRLVRQYGIRKASMSENNLALVDVFKEPNDSEATKSYLDRAGTSSLKVGGVRVLRNCSNSVWNYRAARASDARTLIEAMKARVLKYTGIKLCERIEYMGKW